MSFSLHRQCLMKVLKDISSSIMQRKRFCHNIQNLYIEEADPDGNNIAQNCKDKMGYKVKLSN